MRRVVLYYGRDDDGSGNTREFWRSRRNAYAFWRRRGDKTWALVRDDEMQLGRTKLRTRVYGWPQTRRILFVFDRCRRWVIDEGDDLFGYKFRLVDARELRFTVEPKPPVPEGE